MIYILAAILALGDLILAACLIREQRRHQYTTACLRWWQKVGHVTPQDMPMFRGHGGTR